MHRFSILILLSLNGCMALPAIVPSIPTLPSIRTGPGGPVDTLRMSKPDGTMPQMMTARMTCLEQHPHTYFSCMGSLGWQIDPKGFAPPRYWETQTK